MSSKIRYTLKCLFENKLRFSLTVLSISVGVISVLIVNSVSNYGVTAVSSELDSLGMNGLIVTSESSNAKLTDEEVSKISKLDGVEEVAPVTINTSKVYGNAEMEDTSTMIWGIDDRASNVVSFELLYGRLINKGDIKSNSKVCILDQSLAVELYGKENIVGKTVKLLCNSTVEDFDVVGVVKTGKGIMQSLMGNYFPAFLYVPYTSFENSPNYNQFFLKINDSKSSEEITALVEAELNGRKGSENYAVTDLATQKGSLDSMLNIVTLILTVIGAISLFVSGISIMNIMLISVNERTKEIGIKKSIGATNKDIMLDFLTESIIIAVIGTVLGIIFSITIVKIAAIVFDLDIYIQITTIIYTVCISVVLGIVFGIFPAYKASKFKPVEALRR